MSRRPSVSVIVPVRGDRGSLAVTIAALADQDYDGDTQVIVVDNGDNAALPPPGVGMEVISEATPGSYAARNAGVAAARGEMLAFTDADCRPSPSWLSRGIAALHAAPGSAIGGHIDVQLDGRPTGAALWDRLHGLPQETFVVRDGWAATANMLVCREVFDAVGPFDAALLSGGDREWGERAGRGGTPVVYRSEVVVEHPARSTLAELHTKTLRVHRGWAAAQDRRGGRAASWRELRHRLRPHSRSVLRCAKRLDGQGFGLVARARYVAVAHWLQYVSLIAWLLAARGRRRNGPE